MADSSKKVSLDTTVIMSSSRVVKSSLKLTYWVGMYYMWHPGLHQVHHPKLRSGTVPATSSSFSAARLDVSQGSTCSEHHAKTQYVHLSELLTAHSYCCIQTNFFR